jgi:hypothetical protein
VRLAHAARDELRHLRSEVENQEGLVRHGSDGQQCRNAEC